MKKLLLILLFVQTIVNAQITTVQSFFNGTWTGTVQVDNTFLSNKTLTLNANGTHSDSSFNVLSSSYPNGGTWSYDMAANTLTFQWIYNIYVGMPSYITSTYVILNQDDNTMTIQNHTDAEIAAYGYQRIRYTLQRQALGNPEFTDNKLISVYPNPATTAFTIKSNSSDVAAKVEVVDVLGKVVLAQKIEGGHRVI